MDNGRVRLHRANSRINGWPTAFQERVGGDGTETKCQTEATNRRKCNLVLVNLQTNHYIEEYECHLRR